MLSLTNPPANYSLADFKFTAEQFEAIQALHPLYDATETDLSPFAAKGGKLILWHGWSDPHISPLNTIAYRQGVIDAMGQGQADKMMRLFLFPGLYHCFGGDGLSQFDIVSPLMAWVEAGQAPERGVGRQGRHARLPDGPASRPAGGDAADDGAASWGHAADDGTAARRQGHPRDAADGPAADDPDAGAPGLRLSASRQLHGLGLNRRAGELRGQDPRHPAGAVEQPCVGYDRAAFPSGLHRQGRDAGLRTLGQALGRDRTMARLIGAIGVSHTPTIGYARDRDLSADPVWAPIFEAFAPLKTWLAEQKPDALVMIYNDHVTSFSFDHYSAFALGVGETTPWPTRAAGRATCRRCRAMPNWRAIWAGP
jgi:hypothetical protein